MNSEQNGIPLIKNTKNKIWWLKLGLALILSNIFFFYLFSDNQKDNPSPLFIPKGFVEVQLQAKLLTPFQKGKKVLILHRQGGKKIEGILKELQTDVPDRVIALVGEDQVHKLVQHEHWEILPYLKHLTLSTPRRETHEIRY